MSKFIKGILFLLLAFGGSSLFSQVVINEYSCANATSAGDPDFFGEMEDWVELYNTSGTAINLNGYHLSDKAGNPTKFQIPGAINIPAGGYLMVYCSGRAQIAGGVEIHTNFKLTQTKYEKIIFADPGGTILDSLTINPTQLLHSRGRTTNGAATWSLFTNSTPNASNTGAMQNYATKPTFSLAAGFYTGSQSVTITTPDPNITIHYTTNGNEPTTSDPVYSGPINITSTTVLRARCFSSNASIPPSFIETNTYFINVTHTTPVVSVCGDDVPTLFGGTQNEPIGSVEFFDRNGVMQTETTGDFNKHGNDSWAYPQRGVDFVARDQFGYNHALEYQIFANKSRDEYQHIIFKAGASDNYPFETGGAHIRDPFVQTLSQTGKLKLDERTYDACVMYVNGQYWGVYESREKVDDADFLDYYYDQDEQYKDSPNFIQFLKTWGGTWTEYGPPNAQPDWNSFRTFVTSNNMALQANWDYVDSVYNWQSLVDYFCLNSYIVNKDWLNWNTAWWRGLDPAGDKKKWRYTLWDMDATFGHYVNYTGIPNTSANANPCDVENLPNPGGQGHTEIMVALMNNTTFEQYYISRYIDLGNTVFDCPNMIAVLDSLVNIITPEMPGHIAKWGGSMAQWQNNVQAIRTFINDRCAAISGGLSGCYNLTGPYPMKFNVNPALSGDVKVNSITPANYVFSGNYYGNIDILLKATPKTGYMFDHWEIFNHTLDSAITNRKNSLQITQGDSIIAHFIPIGDTVRLAFDVDPVGSGDIKIDGFTPPSYVYSDYYPETSVMSLQAIPQPGYVFVNWSSNTTPFVPNANDPNVQITVNQPDSIVAHFALLDTFDIEFRVSPLNMGQVDIDTNSVFDDLTTTSIIKSYVTGTQVDLTETPISNYLFDHWGSNHHTLSPSYYSSNVSFVVSGNDVITAYYVEEVLPPPKGAAVPLAFSPNDDGNNDILYVYGGQIESISFQIYDRWGELVFSASSQDNGWDGNYNGQKAASGVYVYKLRAVFTDGDVVTKNGDITLVR
ncbi:MAG: CotH kinase family protein [Flavobacteriales bacterium]|nr:CotH kinase family protein [Flavobacteriales bacterium]